MKPSSSTRAPEPGTNHLIAKVRKSSATYDLLVGTQPDLYRAFMVRTWQNIGDSGVVGLVHPNTHFSGTREGLLRAAAYQRLRVHGDFVNAMLRFFAEVSHVTHFGVHIYGKPQEIRFAHLSWLVDAAELVNSLALAEAGRLPAGWGRGDGVPGVRYKGEWDGRPHPSRVVLVDREVLTLWGRLSGVEDLPASQAGLLSPVSIEEQGAIRALANYPVRFGNFDPRISSGFHEGGAKKDGLIKYDLSHPGDWPNVILKGIQIGLANPMFKSPDANSNDAFGRDLVSMPIDETPKTEYRRATDVSRYEAAQDRWVDHRSGVTNRYAEFYRLAWRKMIAPNTERSLYAAVIPPGPTHVDSVHSMALADNKTTVLAAGFWCSLPLDYLIRLTGKSDLHVSSVKALPFGLPDHPLAPALLLRAMHWRSVRKWVWRGFILACAGVR